MKISMYGELISDEWLWLYQYFEIPCCYPGQVREAIEALAPDEELIIEINCPGGDVWAGFEIFGLLQACKARTEAHVIALAASAATTVISACDTVLASPVAQIMVHQPAARAGWVNNDGARELLNFLDSVKASIINGYVIKSAGKAPRARFEQLVADSTWMPVQDAMELGLVDGFLDADEETAQRIAASGGVLLVGNMACLAAPPTELLKRYEAAVRAGTAQEVPGHPVTPAGPETAQSGPTEGKNDAPGAETGDNVGISWKLKAAVEIERARDLLC